MSELRSLLHVLATFFSRINLVNNQEGYTFLESIAGTDCIVSLHQVGDKSAKFDIFNVNSGKRIAGIDKVKGSNSLIIRF